MKYLLLIIGISLFLQSCTEETYADLVENENTLNLKWNKAYPDDSLEKSITGLKWALSYVGASLPAAGEISVNGNTIIIDVNKLGFTANATEKISQLSEKIKSTQEYGQTNAIDLGRFISLLLGSSEHYYKITESPETLDELLENYTLLPSQGYVDNSSVSLEHRIIRFSEQINFNQVFISTEIDSVSGAVYEYETLELLPNGQLRFGIYDQNGDRKLAADSSHSIAGKPAKCIWCHESSIQPLFNSQNDYPGYLNHIELANILLNYRTSNNSLKMSLPQGVDFSQAQDHTLTELLYISFMEPSVERLALEWGLTQDAVRAILTGLPVHTHHEFPFLGELYDRNDIESLAPFKGLPVSGSIREFSSVEVNYID